MPHFLEHTGLPLTTLYAAESILVLQKTQQRIVNYSKFRPIRPKIDFLFFLKINFTSSFINFTITFPYYLFSTHSTNATIWKDCFSQFWIQMVSCIHIKSFRSKSFPLFFCLRPSPASKTFRFDKCKSISV